MPAGRRPKAVEWAVDDFEEFHKRSAAAAEKRKEIVTIIGKEFQLDTMECARLVRTR